MARSIATAIWKSPVSGRVALRGVNFAGDDQADRRYMAAPTRPSTPTRARTTTTGARRRARLEPALFGENLTLEGIDLSAALIGERWRVGSTVLEVAQIRLPCFKLGIRLGDPRFPQRFQARRPDGRLPARGAGRRRRRGRRDRGRLRPDHDVSLRTMLEALDDDEQARRLSRAGLSAEILAARSRRPIAHSPRTTLLSARDVRLMYAGEATAHHRRSTDLTLGACPWRMPRSGISRRSSRATARSSRTRTRSSTISSASGRSSATR